MNDDTERLRHIADTIRNIEQLSAGLTEEEFNISPGAASSECVMFWSMII